MNIDAKPTIRKGNGNDGHSPPGHRKTMNGKQTHFYCRKITQKIRYGG